MVEPREAALNFEAVKVSFKQDKNGYALTLSVHPNDVPSALAQHLIGQRYIVALVAIGDDGQPMTTVEQQTGLQRVKQAALHCKDKAFQKWMYEMGHAPDESEETASEALRVIVGVKSRADIANDIMAQQRLQRMLENFRKWRDA